MIRCLIRLGLSQQLATIMVNEEGINLEMLGHTSAVEIDNLRKHLDHRVQGMPEANRPLIPFLSFTHGLLAVRQWVVTTLSEGPGLLPHPDDFTVELKVVWLERYRSLKELQDSDAADDSTADVSKLNNFGTDKFRVWKEEIATYLSTLRNPKTGVPLTYLIREESDVSQETLDATYETIDDRLIATTRHDGDGYKADRARLFRCLKTSTVNGSCWSYIKRFMRAKDGRAAYEMLVANAEGDAAIVARKEKAYARIANSAFTGKGKYYFDQYAGAHMTSHNELAFLEEPVAETKKTMDFLDKISDPRLDIAKQTCYMNTAMMADFDLCQTHMKTAALRCCGSRGTTQNEVDRRIAALETRMTNIKKKAKKNGGGKSGHIEFDESMVTGTVEDRFYTPEEFKKLTSLQKAEKAFLKRNKKSKGAEKRKVSAVSTESEEARAAKAAKTTTFEETDDAKSKETAVAGKQFGRRAQKD